MKKLFGFLVGCLLFSIALAQESFQTQPYKSSDIRNFIPKNSFELKPLFIQAINITWPDIPYRGYTMALAEKESCITLTHRRCMNTSSKLDTARELGVGLGQITIAYRLKPGADPMKDYSARIGVRFDALEENKHLDSRLRELNWGNIEKRADLQIILLTAMAKRNYINFSGMAATDLDQLRFANAAYNGGIGGTKKRIAACKMTKNCNPRVWFDGIVNTCMASKKALYGNRSACDINHDHVYHTTVLRLPKYERFISH